MQIVNCEQGSPEWFAARAGIPTASEFAAILTPPKSTKAQAKTRRTYLLKLAGEIVTGVPMDHVSTYHMERGKVMEDEARDLYAFMTDADPQRVGFIRSGSAGCSPDSLIGETGGLEIKTKAPHLMLDILLTGEMPEEHLAQVQGSLWLTNREWWDFVAYWPKLPLFVKRIHRDEEYIAKIAAAVDQFNLELAAAVEKVRAYGTAKREAA